MWVNLAFVRGKQYRGTQMFPFQFEARTHHVFRFTKYNFTSYTYIHTRYLITLALPTQNTTRQLTLFSLFLVFYLTTLHFFEFNVIFFRQQHFSTLLHLIIPYIQLPHSKITDCMFTLRIIAIHCFFFVNITFGRRVICIFSESCMPIVCKCYCYCMYSRVMKGGEKWAVCVVCAGSLPPNSTSWILMDRFHCAVE